MVKEYYLAVKTLFWTHLKKKCLMKKIYADNMRGKTLSLANHNSFVTQ